MTPGTTIKAPLRRLSILSRVLAASVVGYVFTAVVSSVITLALVRTGAAVRSDAVLWASLASFAIHAAAAIWVFSTGTATRAWGSLAAGTAAALATALCTGGLRL